MFDVQNHTHSGVAADVGLSGTGSAVAGVGDWNGGER